MVTHDPNRMLSYSLLGRDLDNIFVERGARIVGKFSERAFRLQVDLIPYSSRFNVVLTGAST